VTPTRNSKTRRVGGKEPEGARAVDDYIAALPKEMRPALIKLRETIRAAAPSATEGISYGIPVFKLNGKGLVGFAAATAHCTFHLMSTTAVQTHAADLKGYKLGQGSIQFPPDKRLPASLVTKLVKTRIAENARTGGAYR
jgi:uncharacterized protein YdhG (YjbR/CyaY superfamily)